MAALIDLHVHTSYSDGSFSPKEIVAMAKSHGLRAIAIADHDTVGGVKEAQAEGSRLGLEVVSAVEVSTAHLARGFHIVGYFIDVDDPALTALLREQGRRRIERAKLIVEKLNGLGFEINFQQLLRSSKGSISRPQIAEAVLAAPENKLKLGPQADGYSVNRFFDEYLKRGGLAYVKKNNIDSCTAIETIAKAGGISAVAHPGANISDDELHFLDSMMACGLDGVEAYCSTHSLQQMQLFCDYARRKGLAITGGSDFHGNVFNEIRLGTGIEGNLALSYEMLEELKTRHRAKARDYLRY